MHPISVCIIARNEEKRIEKCLASIKPYGFEIVVVDTGSTDRTKEIAGKYADVNKSQYYSLKLISINPSAFLDGYWDACYKVFNDCGNEIEGPLLIAISGETGQIYSMEELIMNDSENQNVKISNEPVNERKDKSGTQM